MANLEQMQTAARKQSARPIPSSDVIVANVESRAEKRRRFRQVGIVLVAAAVVVFAFLSSLPDSSQGELRFDDGSVAKFSADVPPSLVVKNQSEERIDVDLKRGVARFEVKKKPNRQFTVHLPNTTVRVTGTIFEIEVSEETTLVRLVEGSVDVSRNGETISLSEGEQTSIQFANASVPVANEAPASEPNINPPEEPPVEFAFEEKEVDAIAIEKTKSEPKKKTTAKELRALLEQGNASVAASRIDRNGNPDDIEGLFVASDVMRAEKRYNDAIRILGRISKSYRKDPRRHLAQFTIGTIKQDRLNDPSGAVKHFARVSVSHPLFEESIVRRYRASNTAGDRTLKIEMRDLYLRHFPNGVYKTQMK